VLHPHISSDHPESKGDFLASKAPTGLRGKNVDHSVFFIAKPVFPY
jgi:hypothetical protein